jgi:cytochrome b involved in lipid metabolism
MNQLAGAIRQQVSLNPQSKPFKGKATMKEKEEEKNNALVKYYTMSEVQNHCENNDAWTVVNGQVYNLTGFLEYHPGELFQIKRAVGIDGTHVFSKMINKLITE